MIDIKEQEAASSSGTIIVMVGLPRSGKSTWARGTGLPIVSPDAIRLALHGVRYLETAERWVWAIAKTMARALLLAGHETIVVDNCCVTHRQRQEWVEEFGAQHVIRFRHVDTPESECIVRARALHDDVIVPVIERMAREFEPLLPDERRFVRLRDVLPDGSLAPLNEKRKYE